MKIKLTSFYYSILIIGLLLSISSAIAAEENSATPEYDTLSLKWALYIQKQPGEEKDKKSQEQHKNKFEQLHKEGYRLYKTKQDELALEKYEMALEIYATAKIYYDYANSLSNTPRIKESIKAYKIAIALKYKKLHFANFNLACVYSRLKDRANSFKYLKIAVEKGYTKTALIKSDGDLKYLRAGTKWAKQLKDIEKTRLKVIYGVPTFRKVRWGMIPWNVLKIEKVPLKREGIYNGYYTLWYQEKFLGLPALLKYHFDKRYYRLRHAGFSFIHITKEEKNNWFGFDFRTKNNGKPISIKNSHDYMTKVYEQISKQLIKKYGLPKDERNHQQIKTRYTHWRTDKQFITLKAYETAAGILDISVYFSNKKIALSQLL